MALRSERVCLLTDVTQKVSHRRAQIKHTDVTECCVICVPVLCSSVRNKIHRSSLIVHRYEKLPA